MLTILFELRLCFILCGKALDVLPGTPGCLNADQIMNLRNLGPTSEEEEAYKKYHGNKELLSDIDQFLMKLIGVPFLRVRLDLQYGKLIHEVCIRAMPKCKSTRVARPPIKIFGPCPRC